MNTTHPQAHRLAAPALVTVAVAAWFVFATGTALAETNMPSDEPAAQTQITLSPEGAMKLKVVAFRPAAQIAMTPDGSLKLTVVALRPQAARAQTAAVRGGSQG